MFKCIAWSGKHSTPTNYVVCNHRSHAEMLLLQQLSSNTKGTLYINVARVKQETDSTGQHFVFSLALPCLHCRKRLNSVSEYRRKKYGQKILLRYTTETGHFSNWCPIDKLPDSKVSSGWRLKYRK